MDELTWLHTNKVHILLDLIGKNPSSRKLRLVACAILRLLADQAVEPAGHVVGDMLEALADRHVGKTEQKTAWQALVSATPIDLDRIRQDETANGLSDWQIARKIEQLPAVRLHRIADFLRSTRGFQIDTLANAARHAREGRHWWAQEPHFQFQEEIAQCSFLRDIFGNPFRPVVFDASWWSDTALSLAKHIYESRDFSAMPILADALQDAGCEHVDILTHCRDESLTHVRGCWVVDLVLGKE